MISVDLLPPDEARAAAARRRTRRLARLAVAAAASALAAAHTVLAIASAATSRDVEREAAARAELERPVAALRRLRQRQASLQSRLAVLARLEPHDGEPVRMLAALAAAAPPGLWLTALRLAGERLELTGVAVDERTIADFVMRLRQVPPLHALDVEEATRDDGARPPVRRFVIAGRVEAGS